MNNRLVLKLFFITILLLIAISIEKHAASGSEYQALNPGITTRVSVASDGTQGNEYSGDPSISADGRYVAFDSASNNLVNGDTNNSHDVFVHDQKTGTTSRVSVASNGAQANSGSFWSSISADGRYVAFTSGASNLVSGDTNELLDVFVHDRQSGTTTRVSVASNGTQGNGSSERLSISADGRYVAFESWASNLVSEDSNGMGDIFVHDRQSGTTTRVSVASNGSQGNGGPRYPSISGDGRYVAFISEASNLVGGDTNGERDVFVHDRQTGVTSRISVASDGSQGNSGSYYCSISGDGRYVAFTSSASNLVSGDTNGYHDIFVNDRQTGVTSRISIASDGTQGNSGSYKSSISDDGRYVAFESQADNMVNGDTRGAVDVFVHDRQTGITSRVSVATDGTEGNGFSTEVSISGDGRYVAFISEASNLVSGDTNYKSDVFAHDREGEIPVSLTINYKSGAPGSYFNIYGSLYPANQDATVSINGTSLGSIATSETGTFTTTLSTNNADEGIFYITVSVNPMATTRFTLNASDPIWSKEGDYSILDVPSGIAYTDEIFLPIVSR